MRQELSVCVKLNELCAEQRDHRHGDKIGSEQRQHHSQRQCGEEILAHAIQEHDGEKHDAGTDGRRQHGELDFLAAHLGRNYRALTHFHVPEDVFEHDHRIVDQAAKAPAPVRPAPLC